jgi:GT2 family glycosyltransferase
MHALLRFLRNLPLLLFSPLPVAVSWLAIVLTDLLWRLAGPRRQPANTLPDHSAASIVIPNWNGRDLLEKYLPSVIAATSGNPRNEVIVVDNGSTDGSAEFVRDHYPQVRLLALPRNLGFGGGSNTGFRQATKDIVVLLNSDMRVAPDFLPPLLAGFTDDLVFAVSCQIFFSDPNRHREETGLTEASWKHGAFRVRHVDDPAVDVPFPCFYGGGGSCAFDRRKFLELGGFDALLSPFYLEDTDLGYQAWKRGWKVLYQPASHVWHEHRGTIGRRFSPSYVNAVVARNFLLFTWKNVHDSSMLAAHFLSSWMAALLGAIAGPEPQRPTFRGLYGAFLRLPSLLASRYRARSLAVVDDREALLRTQAGYFRDRFLALPSAPERLSVLFVSPYPLCPPVHGGGVFMNQTVRVLGRLVDLHLVVLADTPADIPLHDELRESTASQAFLVRPPGGPKGLGAVTPHAVREIALPELHRLIQRQIYLKKIDVLQLEYTNMGQFAGPYHRIACFLFEHDIYFQSIARSFSTYPPFSRAKAAVEYLRAMRWELNTLPRLDQIQTCTEDNSACLLGFRPELRARLRSDLRAGIRTEEYPFHLDGRRPKTLLFLGSFRHLPNQVALNWLLHRVLPRILEKEPDARLLIVGSDPPPAHTIPAYGGAVQLVGYVDQVTRPLSECAVFLCPILSGSGIRVKLLEAFACGIPTVSTRVGAEGLTAEDGLYCALADTPEEFASKTLALLADPEAAAAMASRARQYVVAARDVVSMTARLEASYREVLTSKLRPRPSQPS